MSSVIYLAYGGNGNVEESIKDLDPMLLPLIT